MLKISKLADYAMMLMCDLADDGEKVQSATQLSLQSGIPLPTASKVLKQLSDVALVKAVRGVQGGYLLAKPSAEISVADVIQAIDGYFALTECSLPSNNCLLTRQCTMRTGWQYLNVKVCNLLSSISITDMRRSVGNRE